MEQSKPTIVIADDHRIVRSGLRSVLEAPGVIFENGAEIVAEAENGLDAILHIRKQQPDLLLLDVQMPQVGGAEVVLEVRRWSPNTKVIVLTGVTAMGKVSELVEIGVDGLFSKSDDTDELYTHLPKILKGQRVIAQTFLDILKNSSETTHLTDRERQILNLIVSGRSNKEIGPILGISIKTVDRHRTSLMQKLGVHSVAELLAYALREGLIDSTPEL